MLPSLFVLAGLCDRLVELRDREIADERLPRGMALAVLHSVRVTWQRLASDLALLPPKINESNVVPNTP